MSTFGELKKRLEHLEFKGEVFRMLVDHLDENFRGDRAKLTLMTKNKVKVPDEIFEEVSTEFSRYLQSLDAEATGILSSEVVVPVPVSAETPQQPKSPKGRKPKPGVEDGKPADGNAAS